MPTIGSSWYGHNGGVLVIGIVETLAVAVLIEPGFLKISLGVEF